MNCLHVPKMLMPEEGIDLYKWAVIACDQYTSQPEYWQETKKIVGDAPSALKLTLPEVYLGTEDEAERVREIHETMLRYLADGILKELPAGFMLVKRSFGKENCRYGVVVEVDLETYEYKKGAHSLIRPTEMTVEERIPPRLKVRENAAIEMPHIMLLIDDAECTVIEPLTEKTGQFRQVYDTDLMQGGGHISGWLIPEGNETEGLMNRIEALADSNRFRERYKLKGEYPLLNLAVGDGNHSMATAKAAWEKLKKELSDEELANHPARYCLCEIVNIHDKSLTVEPIHRVLFGVREEELLSCAKAYYEEKGCGFVLEEGNISPTMKEGEHSFTVCSGTGSRTMRVLAPVWGIAAATLQNFLDAYLEKHPECRIDYIHGREALESLGREEKNLGFLLPEVKKEDLFQGVILDGVLPRKTFSMGEADEKRYYLESRMIGTGKRLHSIRAERRGGNE
ncbi:MAG: DUF1015 domain-containing protein [Bacteroidales bacterium]|nr:DUF1015 domain-containing protein [Clostridium sp.]MCM1204178.1 DUF1015 domain-containing protein [Bacteroidales bacterium]